MAWHLQVLQYHRKKEAFFEMVQECFPWLFPSLSTEQGGKSARLLLYPQEGFHYMFSLLLLKVWAQTGLSLDLLKLLWKPEITSGHF